MPGVPRFRGPGATWFTGEDHQGRERMAPGRFFPALACGAIPTGFAFAGLGAIGSDRPVLTVALATVLPLALWPLVRLGARNVALQE